MSGITARVASHVAADPHRRNPAQRYRPDLCDRGGRGSGDAPTSRGIAIDFLSIATALF
jgi:hypothetical protein